VKPTSHVAVVRLHASLQELAGKRDIEVSLPDGAIVRDLLNRMVELEPSLTRRLLDTDGNIPRHVNVFVNGRDIRYLSGMDTPVTPNDEVTIIPPVAGG
jgi:molybdopterin synthase sulfur carrier subunit